MAALAGCNTTSTSDLVAATHLPGSPGHTRAANNETVEDTTGHLRVMSANVRCRTMLDLHNNWPNRRHLMLATIKRFRPDLLGTQEVKRSQARDLREGLPEYEFVGVGRSDGDDSGEMCAVFFRRDRFTLLDSGHFWLSDDPDDVGSRAWGAWFPRMVTWVKLAVREQPGRSLYFFNTHFSAVDRSARRNAARVMRRRIRKIAGGAPTIVTGDFNAGEGSRPYRIMTRGHVEQSRPFTDTYRSARPERGDAENTLHNFGGGIHGQRIDWILTSRVFETVDAAIDRTHVAGRYPSDHFPVQAVLHWPTAVAAK